MFKVAPSELKFGIRGNARIYCDRYFTSPKLIDFTLSKGIYVTGTVMKNRIPEAITKLPSEKELLNQGRGASDVFVQQDTKIAMVKWFDNKPIVMSSAIHGKKPEDDCSRWSKDKAYILVKHPAIIHEYNKMGGVDLCDQRIALYRMKTWKRNSWILYRMDQMIRCVARKDILQFLDLKLNVAI